ncbi:MAG: hypothetical protein ACR2HG_02265 [Pyrinomonadaceae bacterium]
MILKSEQKLYFYCAALVSVLLIVFAITQFRLIATANAQNAAAENCLQTNTNHRQKGKKKKKTKMKQPKLTTLQTGSWGGNGIGLTIEADGAKITFDCADGEIKQKLEIDENGNFSLSGFYTQQRGGPIVLNDLPKPQPALYEGAVSGSKMTLKVVLTETKNTIGEYKLERDKYANIHRCL